jgi:hypothetical protein
MVIDVERAFSALTALDASQASPIERDRSRRYLVLGLFRMTRRVVRHVSVLASKRVAGTRTEV